LNFRELASLTSSLRKRSKRNKVNRSDKTLNPFRPMETQTGQSEKRLPSIDDEIKRLMSNYEKVQERRGGIIPKKMDQQARAVRKETSAERKNFCGLIQNRRVKSAEPDARYLQKTKKKEKT